MCRARVPTRTPALDRLTRLAVNYYRDFVAPGKRYRAPDERESAAFLDLIGRFERLPDDADDTTFQNEIYAVGNDHGFEPLRAWFQALYEVLLGQSAGPRFGSFAALYGRDETVALLRNALAGDAARADTSGTPCGRHGRTGPDPGKLIPLPVAATGGRRQVQSAPSLVVRSHRKNRTASAAPAICAATNAGACAGTIPEKVSVRLRAIVTAGLAKEVEEVYQ